MRPGRASWWRQHIGFHCDSQPYVEFAWGLFGYPVPPLVLWARTAGYPLLLALSGTVGPNAAFHSFLGILLVQAAMAVAMPVLIFKTLEAYNPRVAVLTALVLIVSLQPYIASKLVMNEQGFKFFLVLLVYLAVKTYQSQSPRWWVVALSLTSAFLVLLRPAALLIVAVVFAGLLFSRWKCWKPLTTGILGFGAVLFVYSFVVCLLLPPTGLHRPGAISRLTDLAFYDLYMQDNASGLRPREGRPGSELREVAHAFARDLKAGWIGRRPAKYFAPFADDPKGWVESLFTDPNPFKYAALKDAVSIYQDQGTDADLKLNARGVIRRATLEAYVYEPWRLISMTFRYGSSFPGSGNAEKILFNKIFSLMDLFVSSSLGRPIPTCSMIFGPSSII